MKNTIEGHFISNITDDDIKQKKFPVYAVLFVKRLSRLWKQKNEQRRKSLLDTANEIASRETILKAAKDFENKMDEVKGKLL